MAKHIIHSTSRRGRWIQVGSTVTIDKSNFETLLRRAHFHASGQEFLTPLDLPTVTIPNVDHDNLLRIADEHMRLRDALYREGFGPETLATLIRSGQNIGGNATTFYGALNSIGVGQHSTNQALDPSTKINTSDYGALITAQRAQDSRHTGKSPLSMLMADRKNSLQHPGTSGYDESCFPDDIEKDERGSHRAPGPEQMSIPCNNQRTILIKNLTDQTTHQDIAHIVRGGMLLDVYIRRGADKSANVSFVHGTAAQEFMAFAKRHEIYIYDRKLAFAWSDHQYFLPGWLANKIGNGATWNLAIRRLDPKITETQIREDLKHIDKLVIVNISFANGDAYLSLSSVRSSLFARTCMMSRKTYKGLQIEWDADECALPLPPTPNTAKKAKAPASNSNGNSMVNRFQLLDMDSSCC